MDIQILNPLEIRNWDELLLSNENSSFFHSSPWAKVLHDTYGYKPIYFCSLENGKLSSLMPFMEVNSWLTGKRGVSLPFTDACDSITCDIEAFRTAVNAVKEYGREVCWKTVEWRGNGEYLADAPPSSSYFTHMLQLGDPEEQIFSGFKSNTRRNINKAIKEGVRVKIGNSLESVELYYRLHCRTRRHLRTYYQ
ncbi:MAG: peptidoglycan bridge formation glycyltransferase FemA/FemB family protein [Deltaproteobacteria bacterium]